MDSAIADGAVLGVTVTVAAGDNGSSDDPNNPNAVNVDFPASSPNALGCGGTQLIGDVSTFTITSEVVWNELANNEGAGGGGVSVVFPLPSWQANAGVPASAAGGSTRPAAGCPTWPAMPTRRPGTWSSLTASSSRSAGPARWPPCGRG